MRLSELLQQPLEPFLPYLPLIMVYRDIEHIWQLSYRGGFYRGGPVLMSALSGIDIALWDMKGTEYFERLGSARLLKAIS